MTVIEFSFDKSALLLCDVYNNHWCKEQTKRYEAIAQKIGRVASAFQKKGMCVVHSPSGCTTKYVDTSQYQRMIPFLQAPPLTHRRDIPTPHVPITTPRTERCECCCTPRCDPHSTWTCEHQYIPLGEKDIICDNGPSIYLYLEKQGITTLFYAGFALNMCMLERDFGIPQMLRWGINCLFIRDLTDVFYISMDASKMTHDAALQGIVSYVEDTYCPSVTSEELLRALNEH